MNNFSIKDIKERQTYLKSQHVQQESNTAAIKQDHSGAAAPRCEAVVGMHVISAWLSNNGKKTTIYFVFVGLVSQSLTACPFKAQCCKAKEKMNS